MGGVPSGTAGSSCEAAAWMCYLPRVPASDGGGLELAARMSTQPSNPARRQSEAQGLVAWRVPAPLPRSPGSWPSVCVVSTSPATARRRR